MFQKLYNFFLFFFFKYPTPINLNYLWNFGVLSLIFFITQLLTGIFLSMFYIPNVDLAFFSVENIMRNINTGWFIRYAHANGASLFFVVVYFHLFRNLYYKSYLPPRRFVWLIGVIIFLIMIMTAFTGYVLPWGQMSFWAATVITNLFSAIPFFGNDLVLLLWGNYTVSNSTLNRFFSFHFLLPFILLILIIIHLVFLHEKGSTNPLKVYNLYDKILFNPYYTIKDLVVIINFFYFLIYLILFNPNLLGHSDNYIEANPLVTPSHIVPEWYFLLFYAILRSIPSKLGGFLALLFSIFILLIFPFFYKKFNKININLLFKYRFFFINWWKIINFKILLFVKKDYYIYLLQNFFLILLNYYNIWRFNIFFYNFIFTCIVLSVLGSYPAEGVYLIFSKFFMWFYFFYFLILIFDIFYFWVFILFYFIYYFSIFNYNLVIKKYINLIKIKKW